MYKIDLTLHVRVCCKRCTSMVNKFSINQSINNCFDLKKCIQMFMREYMRKHLFIRWLFLKKYESKIKAEKAFNFDVCFIVLELSCSPFTTISIDSYPLPLYHTQSVSLPIARCMKKHVFVAVSHEGKTICETWDNMK